MNNHHVYDMLVVGGGPGGYTAALYAARAGVDTIVLEKLSAGGQMALTEQIDNYPGFEDGIDGFSLAEKMQKQAEGHTLKTRLICRNITVTALSASTLTFSTAPGAQANTSAKVCPGPVLERMLRFPQISSCTMRALPASTRPTSSTGSPARSRREPLGKVSILAPRQESMTASSSSEMPEKSAAV